jgi:CP family cyanate transporter-like MFS transporter
MRKLDTKKIIAIAVGGANINLSSAVLGPILNEVQAFFRVSDVQAGMLTTTMLMVCAVCSLPVGMLCKKVDPTRIFSFGLAAFAVGNILRTFSVYEIALVGSAIAGFGVISGAICIPVLILRDFRNKINAMNSMFAAVMTTAAFFLTAVAAQIAASVSWQFNFYIIAAIATATLVYWFLAYDLPTAKAAKSGVPNNSAATETNEAAAETELSSAATLENPAVSTKTEPKTETSEYSGKIRPPFRRITVWLLAIFLALNTFCYFSFNALLPKMLGEDGLKITESAEQAGVFSSLFLLIGILGTIGITVMLKTPLKDFASAAIIFVCWISLPLGMIFAPELIIFWLVLSGYAQGSSYVYVFILLSKITHQPAESSKITSILQLLGYGIGGLGPTITAMFFEISVFTGLWELVILLAIEALAVFILLFRIQKGKLLS